MSSFLSILVSEPDHFRVTEVNGYDSQRLKQLQEIVGGYLEMVSVAFDSWCFLANEDGKSQGQPVNRAATRFADVLFVDAGRPPFSLRDHFVGPVALTGLSSTGDDRDVPIDLISKYTDSALLLSHVAFEASTFITVIRVRFGKEYEFDDIFVYDQGDSRITDKIIELAKAARQRRTDGLVHGEIEVWPAISPGKWVELRVDLMDQLRINLHDKREDRSYG